MVTFLQVWSTEIRFVPDVEIPNRITSVFQFLPVTAVVTIDGLIAIGIVSRRKVGH